jgi:hypothetical protein
MVSSLGIEAHEEKSDLPLNHDLPWALSRADDDELRRLSGRPEEEGCEVILPHSLGVCPINLKDTGRGGDMSVCVCG